MRLKRLVRGASAPAMRAQSPQGWAEGEQFASDFLDEIDSGQANLAEEGFPELPTTRRGVDPWVDKIIHSLDLDGLQRELFSRGYGEIDFQAFVYAAAMTLTKRLEARTA
jgi:hypothetical protein